MKKMTRLIKMAGYDVVTPNLLEDGEAYTLRFANPESDTFDRALFFKTLSIIKIEA